MNASQQGGPFRERPCLGIDALSPPSVMQHGLPVARLYENQRPPGPTLRSDPAGAFEAVCSQQFKSWRGVDLFARIIGGLQRGRGQLAEAQQAVDAMLAFVRHVLFVQEQ